MPIGPDTDRQGSGRTDRATGAPSSHSDWHWTVSPESPEEFEAESHEEYRVRTFFKGSHVAGADHFTGDFDEALENMQLDNWHENISVGGVHPNVGNTVSEHAAGERRDYTDHLESIGEDRETDPTRGYNQFTAQKARKEYIAKGTQGQPGLPPPPPPPPRQSLASEEAQVAAHAPKLGKDEQRHEDRLDSEHSTAMGSWRQEETERRKAKEAGGNPPPNSHGDRPPERSKLPPPPRPDGRPHEWDRGPSDVQKVWLKDNPPPPPPPKKDIGLPPGSPARAEQPAPKKKRGLFRRS